MIFMIFFYSHLIAGHEQSGRKAKRFLCMIPLSAVDIIDENMSFTSSNCPKFGQMTHNVTISHDGRPADGGGQRIYA